MVANPLKDGSPSMNVQSPLDKVIPKLCTNVNFVKLSDGKIIISLLFQEPQELSENNNASLPNATLIERVVVDEGHANLIVKVLSDLLKNNKNN